MEIASTAVYTRIILYNYAVVNLELFIFKIKIITIIRHIWVPARHIFDCGCNGEEIDFYHNFCSAEIRFSASKNDPIVFWNVRMLMFSAIKCKILRVLVRISIYKTNRWLSCDVCTVFFLKKFSCDFLNVYRVYRDNTYVYYNHYT